jgi:hypothetical protein
MRPDLSLIRDYTREAANVWRAVAVTHFQQDNKNLYYINAHHVTNTNNATCETVRKAILAFEPQLVIIEGLPTQCGISPAGYLDYLHAEEVPRNFPAGEISYAAFLASQKGIPFVGGEPSDEDTFANMEAEGYSIQDVMAFYLVRSIPQYRQHGQIINEVTFDAFATEFLRDDGNFGHVAPSQRLTLQEFKAWFESHSRASQTLLTITPEDFAPYASEDADYLQRLNRALTLIRERHLNALIGNALSDHDKVLVVYGDGHLFQSSRVFEQMLGPGKTSVLCDRQSPPDVAAKTADSTEIQVDARTINPPTPL